MYAVYEALSVPEREDPTTGAPRVRGRRVWPRTLSAVTASTTAIVAVVLVFRPHFLVNDDATMAAFANGDYATRDWHLVFIHGIPSRFLVGLYAAVPEIPWYTWLLLACWVVSWAAFIYVGLFGARLASTKILVAGSIIACLPATVLQLTFTSAGIGLAVGGVVLLVAGTQRVGRPRSALVNVAGLLLVASSMIRWHALLAVVAMFLPLLAAMGRRAGFRRALAFAAVVVAFASGLRLVDREIYDRGDWKTFREFNDPRGELHGTSRLEPTARVEDALRQHGWTLNDLQLFSMFMYSDPDVYTADAVRAIRDATSLTSTRDIGEKLLASFWTPYRHLIVGGLGFTTIALVRLRRIRDRVLMAASSLWFLAMLALLAVFARLPSALGTPLLMGALLLATIVPDLHQGRLGIDARACDRTRRLHRSLLPGAVLAVAVALGLHSAMELSERGRTRRERLASEMRALKRADPEGTFVGVGATFSYEYADPLAAATGFRNLRYLELGWPQFSPHYQRRLAELRLHDVYGDIVWKPHTYLVAPPIAKDRLETYYLEHRGWEVRFREVGKLTRSTPIWEALLPTSAETGELITSDPRPPISALPPT